MKNVTKSIYGLMALLAVMCSTVGCNPSIEYVDKIVEKVYAAPVVITTTDAGDSGVTITMETATEGATIYYTEDGSTPTDSSTVYSEALTYDTDTTVKAIAVKTGIENSPVSSVTITIKTKTVTNTVYTNAIAAGTYNVYHLQQNTTDGINFSDYALASTDSSKYVEADSTIEDLKNTYTGFTEKTLVKNETDIYIFYDRNTITYTFNTGSNGKHGGGIGTVKTVSGLYGAICTIPDPISNSDSYKFSKWINTSGTALPSVFGAENLTFNAIWEEKDAAAPSGFVKVSGGVFKMGSEEGYDDNRPIHNVVISKSFYMCDHEVTQSEYKAVMGSNPSRDEDALPDGTYANKPVDQTSWYMAIVYCNKKSIKESLTPCYTINGETEPDKWGAIPKESDSTWNGVTCNFTANGYRLPTEAEWEYAARAGDNTLKHLTYSGTSDSSKLSDYAWFNENAERSSHEVKQKKPNALGLYDMSGNVDEWCWDWFAAYTSEDAVDPTGSPGSGKRVHRGGAAFFAAYHSAVSERVPNIPELNDMRNGFRVCRSRL